MLSTMILPIVLAAAMQVATQTDREPEIMVSDSGKKPATLIAQYYDAGPVHGPNPDREIHDYGLPAHPNYSNDPYGGTEGRMSDPYGGTQGFISDPYGGTAPYAPY